MAHIIDSRIRNEHIARYGATDEIEDYLRTLENLVPVPDDKPGQNHHMLAQSVWVRYADFKTHPWNRLRVSRRIHIALTELQSRFEERLRSAVLLMKGQTVEAFLEGIRRGAEKRRGRPLGRRGNRAVSILKRVKVNGGFRHCPTIETARGGIEANVVMVNGREERHPEGTFYLSFYEGKKQIRVAVGEDADHAMRSRELKEAELILAIPLGGYK
jgi:hypothetical protein